MVTAGDTAAHIALATLRMSAISASPSKDRPGEFLLIEEDVPDAIHTHLPMAIKRKPTGTDAGLWGWTSHGVLRRLGAKSPHVVIEIRRTRTVAIPLDNFGPTRHRAVNLTVARWDLLELGNDDPEPELVSSASGRPGRPGRHPL